MLDFQSCDWNVKMIKNTIKGSLKELAIEACVLKDQTSLLTQHHLFWPIFIWISQVEWTVQRDFSRWWSNRVLSQCRRSRGSKTSYFKSMSKKWKFSSRRSYSKKNLKLNSKKLKFWRLRLNRERKQGSNTSNWFKKWWRMLICRKNYNKMTRKIYRRIDRWL